MYVQERGGWTKGNSMHVYCIRHTTQNFTRQFKNATLKKNLTNMGKLLYSKEHFFLPCSPFYHNLFH